MNFFRRKINNDRKKNGIRGILHGLLAYFTTKLFLFLQRIPKRRIQYNLDGFSTNINLGSGINWYLDNQDWIDVIVNKKYSLKRVGLK